MTRPHYAGSPAGFNTVASGARLATSHSSWASSSFKFDVIARLPHEGFKLTAEQIDQWLQTKTAVA
jgi:hypothetical protein